VDDGAVYLGRTHPLVEALAAHVMDSALDPIVESVARRAGAVRTDAVSRRTTLLLVRFRHDIKTRRGGEERAELAEECGLLAFEGAPAGAKWLDAEAAQRLLNSKPVGNIAADQAQGFVRRVIEGFDALRPELDAEAGRRASALLDAHRRVRDAAGLKGVTHKVEPHRPPDVLGVYVYLPAAGGR
jgi:hypothetical protein